jgi:hypothetical protein
MKNSNPGLLLPKNIGQKQEVPPVKRWRVCDSCGNMHEFAATGFNQNPGSERVDFFIVKDAPGTIIQSTEMMTKMVRNFFSPASIEIVENDTAAPAQN